MVCLLDVGTVASDENHRCAASIDDNVNEHSNSCRLYSLHTNVFILQIALAAAFALQIGRDIYPLANAAASKSLPFSSKSLSS